MRIYTCRSENTVTGTHSASFSSAMVGSIIVFFDGTRSLITGFIDSTHLSVADSGDVEEQQYNIYYPGFNATSGGNVGIGITSPSEKLHIYDGDMIIQRPYGSPTQLKIESTNSDSKINLRYNGATKWMIGNDHSDYDKFKIAIDDIGVTDKVTILQDGNVGIGTTSPGEKLEVNGDIKFGSQGVKISTGTTDPSGGSDGDLYIRKNGANTKLCINVNGTWKKCTLESL